MKVPPLLVLALLACVSAPTTAQPTLRVVIDGAVSQPGIQQWPTDARLADAILKARPNNDAYPTGASLLRREAQLEQTRAKAGLMFDLQALHARTEDLGLRMVARRMADWLEGLPVTGRVRAELAPRRTEVELSKNPPLADGDRISYPTRPATVRIVGAVMSQCVLAHEPLRDAVTYAQACPHTFADRDWLFVIQPDGEIEKLGVAAWNRSPPHALAPGATLLVPLPERSLRAIDPNFNLLLAEFIATQPIEPAQASDSYPGIPR